MVLTWIAFNNCGVQCVRLPLRLFTKNDGVHMDCVQQLWRAMCLTTSFALQKHTMVFTWIAFNNCGVQCFDYIFRSSEKYDGVHMDCV